jgi:hypothetical protein
LKGGLEVTERERIRRKEQSAEARRGGRGAAPPVEGIASDIIEGVTAIAAYLGKNERRTYYLLENGKVPAFKLSGKWHLRRSTYASYIASLEAAAIRIAK